MLGADFSGNDIFVNYHDVEDRCAFFTYVLTGTSQKAQSSHQNILGRVSYPLFLCNKCFDQKLQDVFALVVFSIFVRTILFWYQSRDFAAWPTLCDHTIEQVEHWSNLSLIWVWTLNLLNLNHLYQRILCAKFCWNLPNDSAEHFQMSSEFLI